MCVSHGDTIWKLLAAVVGIERMCIPWHHEHVADKF